MHYKLQRDSKSLRWCMCIKDCDNARVDMEFVGTSNMYNEYCDDFEWDDDFSLHLQFKEEYNLFTRTDMIPKCDRMMDVIAYHLVTLKTYLLFTPFAGYFIKIPYSLANMDEMKSLVSRYIVEKMIRNEFIDYNFMSVHMVNKHTRHAYTFNPYTPVFTFVDIQPLIVRQLVDAIAQMTHR